MRGEYYLTPRLWQRARKACTEAPGTLTSKRQTLKVMTRYLEEYKFHMSNNDPSLTIVTNY